MVTMFTVPNKYLGISADKLPYIAAEHAQLAEWLSLLKVYTDTHMAEEVQRARHEMHGWQLEWKREMERREELESENARLRELCASMYAEMQGVLDMSTDTVWVDKIGTLRDHMDAHMEAMRELGIQPPDYEQRMRELGIEPPCAGQGVIELRAEG
jgi:hypothetical protein